jgi:hypothetical protein
MSPSLLNSPKRLFTSALIVAAAIVIVVLIPCPVSAIPITALEPTPSSPPSPDLSMNDKVTFDIVFGLGLFILTIGAFVFVASSKSFTRFNGFIDRGFLSSSYGALVSIQRAL